MFDLDACIYTEYAQKAHDRRSVSGAATVCGGRTHKSVTLSTTEAEYLAARAEGVPEAMCLRIVLSCDQS